MAKQRKLGRTSNKRRAMLRALVTDLIIYGRIETTEMRAKEVQRIADKMVTLGKRQDLHARRQAASFLLNKVAGTKTEMQERRIFKTIKVEGQPNKREFQGVETVEVTVDQTAVQRLFEDVAPKYMERNGGYTRVVKTAPRRGDNASMAIIEFV